MSMPQQKPGQSKQDYQTPPKFIQAVKRLLGIEEFRRDLAASEGNAYALDFYTKEENAFTQPWYTGSREWNWCNPPFASIEPWVLKAFFETQKPFLQDCGQTAMLVPSSTGSLWWGKWVHGQCRVVHLSPRLTFVGEVHPYPKDLSLLLYAPTSPLWIPGVTLWRWKP